MQVAFCPKLKQWYSCGPCRELLRRIGADARLFVFDKDPQAIAVANALAAEDKRVQVVHGYRAI